MFRHVAFLWHRHRQRLFVAALLDHGGRERFAETMLVVGIVALLVALTAHSAQPFVTKAKLTEAMSLTSTERVNVVEYLAVTGRLPRTLPLESSSQRYSGKYVDLPEWRDDELVVAIRPPAGTPDVQTADADKVAPTLAFRLATEPVSGHVVWLCGERKPPPGFTAAAPRHTTLPARSAPYLCRAESEVR